MRTRSKYLKFSVNNEGKILIQHDFYKYFDDKHDCEYKVFIIYGNKIFPELDYEECTNKKTGITNIKFDGILYVTELYIRSMNGPESRDTKDYVINLKITRIDNKSQYLLFKTTLNGPKMNEEEFYHNLDNLINKEFYFSQKIIKMGFSYVYRNEYGNRFLPYVLELDTNDYSSRRFQNHPINKRLKTYVEQRILSSIFKDAN